MRSFWIIVAVLGSLALGLISLVAFYLMDSNRNRGWHFGYWGEFNRVSNTIASIPGVAVTTFWHNADVTLEEFGFDVSFKGTTTSLFFGETNAIRSMPPDQMLIALKRKIGVGSHNVGN